jgi:DNA-binding NarL/FixJ family response regulator
VSTKASGDPAREPIGVFILDDHEIARRGIRGLLEAEPDIRVIGEAGTASAALAQIPALRPDVAVLDVRLPDGDGVSVCREVRSQLPGVACLIFTAFSDDEALLDSIMAGAVGYVLKQVRGSDLVGAVRTAASGHSLLTPRAASKLIGWMRDTSGEHDPLAGLTPHERNVLKLIGEGLTNKQIGERLFLAEKTVKNYVSTLFRKLGLEQRTAAAAYVARASRTARPDRARQWPDRDYGAAGRWLRAAASAVTRPVPPVHTLFIPGADMGANGPAELVAHYAPALAVAPLASAAAAWRG